MQNEIPPASSGRVTRRAALRGGAAALGALTLPGWVRAQANPTIRIGYWPIAAGLPFFAAVEEGFFREAGLNVEVQRYAGAQQVMEAMLAGRCDGSATGTGSAFLAIGEIASPGLLKFFCTNPSNEQYVLEEFIVPQNSGIASLAELSGRTVGAAAGIQNVTLARTVLARAGATNVNLVELPLPQHVPAIAAGQVAACYTLEPQGTIGRLNGTARILEAGVVAKYILGDPQAPWHGGAASLAARFLNQHPQVAAAYIEAYRRGVEYVRANPDESRKYFAGYTAIEGDLTHEVPLSAYMFYDEFDADSIAYFQTFFDLFTDNGIFARRLEIEPLLYRG